MSWKSLRAYIAYRCKAKHRNGHGVHSPFMYELVCSVFFAKREKNEPGSKHERTCARLNTFCNKHGLKLVQIKEKNDFIFYSENCIAILTQPNANPELWRFLRENKNTRVAADCWKFGLALAIPHLQKQRYIIKV